MGKKVGFGIHPTNLGLSAEIIAFMVATESVFGIAVDIDGLSVKGSTGNLKDEDIGAVFVLILDDVVFF